MLRKFRCLAVLRAFLFVALSTAGIAAFTATNGCAGQQARDRVLSPAAAAAAPGVESDARHGLSSLPDDPSRQAADAQLGAFFAAIASRDSAQIKSAVAFWPQVKALAEAGIARKLADGAIGANVAESLNERIRNFEESLLALAR